MGVQEPVGAMVEVAKTTKEVLPQTTTQADGALSTLVGWFNNVVLYPVKKANITYRYKLSALKMICITELHKFRNIVCINLI